MIHTRTWPYGTKRRADVQCTDWRPARFPKLAPGATLVLDDQDELHVLLGGACEAGVKKGDLGTLVFTQGGPTGGYWKFTKDSAIKP